MPKIIAQLRHFLATEPAVTAWALSGGLALLVAYAFHWDHTRQAAAATAVTAAAAAYSALRARPAHIQAVMGALVTVVTAAGTFGFHPSPRAEALILAAASAALAWLYRANLTPAATVKRQKARAARQLRDPAGSL